MKKSRHINLKECYEILQLPKDARLEDVKKAYRKRAFELHPDLNPHSSDAGLQFQRLNEAYVALSQVLQTEEATQKTAGHGAEGGKERASGKKEGKAGAENTDASKQEAHKADEQKTQAQREAERKKQQSASAAYEKEYEKEDVLRDLLNDSFARRVFEDIYSELNRQTQNLSGQAQNTSVHKPSAGQAKTSGSASSSASSSFFSSSSSGGGGTGLSSPSIQATRVEVDSGPLPFSGLANKMKGWLLHQIDAKQIVKMPTATLFPGARIRLQIRQGLSEDLKTFEITLPKDFAVGKPMRLRGLGKKVGRWQGDLYITIESI